MNPLPGDGSRSRSLSDTGARSPFGRTRSRSGKLPVPPSPDLGGSTVPFPGAAGPEGSKDPGYQCSGALTIGLLLRTELPGEGRLFRRCLGLDRGRHGQDPDPRAQPTGEVPAAAQERDQEPRTRRVSSPRSTTSPEIGCRIRFAALRMVVSGIGRIRQPSGWNPSGLSSKSHMKGGSPPHARTYA